MTNHDKTYRVRAVGLAILAGAAAAGTGCAGRQGGAKAASPASAAEQQVVVMASTIGPIEAGLVPLLEDLFEKDAGTRVRHLSLIHI